MRAFQWCSVCGRKRLMDDVEPPVCDECRGPRVVYIKPDPLCEASVDEQRRRVNHERRTQ